MLNNIFNLYDEPERIGFLQRCKEDHAFYCENVLFIRTDDQDLLPFQFNEFQKLLHKLVCEVEAAGRPKRFIVVKPRRVGCSTYIQSRLFRKWHLERNTDVRVVAQEASTAEDIFRMAKIYYEELHPSIKPTIHKNNILLLSTLKTYCNYKIHTAGTKIGVRGGGAQFIHFTEVAYYENPALIVGAKKAVKSTNLNTEVWLESTPNGRNYFFDRYMDAKSEDSDYVPVFYPWFDIPEYTLKFSNEITKEKFMESVLNHKHLEQWGDEEQLMKDYPAVTFERLNWRRKCIINDCDKDVEAFNADFPTDDITCFATSGKIVFPVSIVNDMLAQTITEETAGTRGRLEWKYDSKNVRTKDVDFVKDEKGLWTIYRFPDHESYRRRYVSGWDIGGGAEDGDLHYAKIYDRQNPLLKFGAAKFNGELDSPELANELLKAHYYYDRDLYINVEANNTGKAVIDTVKEELEDFLYTRYTIAKKGGIEEKRSHFGFYTTGATKPTLVSKALKFMKELMFIDYDTEFWKQCGTFIKEPSARGYLYHAIKKGAKGSIDRCFDDGVMAWMLMIEFDDILEPCVVGPVKLDDWEKEFIQREHVGESYMSG